MSTLFDKCRLDKLRAKEVYDFERKMVEVRDNHNHPFPFASMVADHVKDLICTKESITRQQFMMLENPRLLLLLWEHVKPATRQEFLDIFGACISGTLGSNFVFSAENFSELMASAVSMLQRCKHLYAKLDHGTPTTPPLHKNGPGKSLFRLILDKLEADLGAVVHAFLPPEFEKLPFASLMDTVIALIRADDPVYRVVASKEKLMGAQRKERLKLLPAADLPKRIAAVDPAKLTKLNQLVNDEEEYDEVLFALTGSGKMSDKACWACCTGPDFTCTKTAGTCGFSHDPKVLAKYMEESLAYAVSYKRTRLKESTEQIKECVDALLR